MNDFNTTAFDITFPADEFGNIADVPEAISIVDDEIDEAQEQFFIIVLEVLEAVNFDLLRITRNISVGTIVDNEGESLPGITYISIIFITLRYSNWVCAACILFYRARI